MKPEKPDKPTPRIRLMAASTLATSLILSTPLVISEASETETDDDTPSTISKEDRKACLAQTIIERRFMGWHDPKLANEALNAGWLLLQQLLAAQIAIDEQHPEQAREALSVSEHQAKSIERMMPYTVLVKGLTDSDQQLVGGDVKVFYEDLLPIHVPPAALSMNAATSAGPDHHDQHAAGQTFYLPVGYVNSRIKAAVAALSQTQPAIETARRAIVDALNSMTTGDKTIFPG